AIVQFEQTRVNDEVWLPASATIRADGRVALFKHIRSELDLRFQNYRKFEADSHLVVGPAPK
ncbi:MAG TPA: hypothetical protein VFW83_04000, partial [Bryobacteraceae bacterium]|nr:hypothetical protein [Bryobacteraceae bacterium]